MRIRRLIKSLLYPICFFFGFSLARGTPQIGDLGAGLFTALWLIGLGAFIYNAYFNPALFQGAEEATDIYNTDDAADIYRTVDTRNKYKNEKLSHTVEDENNDFKTWLYSVLIVVGVIASIFIFMPLTPALLVIIILILLFK
jgi:hypothetical protein